MERAQTTVEDVHAAVFGVSASQNRESVSGWVTDATSHSQKAMGGNFSGFYRRTAQVRGYNAILVVVDKFSKYAHFIPLTHPFIVLDIAKVFMQEIFKLHGLPLGIISDRDRIFTGQVWQELFRLCRTELKMSSSYHPQTDGQTERANQCLETYLRCLVHSCPGNWSKWLALAEYCYNTCYHSALGRTPFEVIYGHLPESLAYLRWMTAQCLT